MNNKPKNFVFWWHNLTNNQRKEYMEAFSKETGLDFGMLSKPTAIKKAEFTVWLKRKES
jgi:hypothetical protein